jgi:cytochrome c5
MLKLLLLLSAVTLIAITSASAQGRKSQKAAPAPSEASTTDTTPAPDPMAKAKRLYSQDCAMCHGDNGNGKSDLATSMSLTLPDWTDPKALAGKDDKYLFNQIRNGKDKMPPEDSARAKDEDVQNLITYLRGLSKQQ